MQAISLPLLLWTLGACRTFDALAANALETVHFRSDFRYVAPLHASSPLETGLVSAHFRLRARKSDRLLAASAAPEPAGCGEVFTVTTHAQTTTRYAYAAPAKDAPGRAILVLLAGGGGRVDLDDHGCARELKGNSLVRSIPLFHAEGVATALVDAPSDHAGEDGLGGFRTSAQHADDLGRIIADLRRRFGGPVWLVGTSRGTISAANAGARLAGPAAPDGLVLTSPVTSGNRSRKGWTDQTVFDADLAALTLPLLVVSHAADRCARSPAALAPGILARTRAQRRQMVTIAGQGANEAAPASLDACQGRSAHGFLGHESEVAAGIARFVRGENY